MTDDIIKTPYEEKVEKLSGMHGLVDSAVAKEAERLADLSSEGAEEDEFFSANKEDLGEDVIIPEEQEAEKAEEKGEKKEESEDEEEISIPEEYLDNPEVKKLLNANKHLRKSNKKLGKKLGQMERKYQVDNRLGYPRRSWAR